MHVFSDAGLFWTRDVIPGLQWQIIGPHGKPGPHIELQADQAAGARYVLDGGRRFASLGDAVQAIVDEH